MRITDFDFHIKDAVKSVLRFSSAHNKGRHAYINIAQILHPSNLFVLKRRVYIHLQAWRSNQKRVRYSVSISDFTNIAVQNVDKAFVYIMDFTASLI